MLVPFVIFRSFLSHLGMFFNRYCFLLYALILVCTGDCPKCMISQGYPSMYIYRGQFIYILIMEFNEWILRYVT